MANQRVTLRPQSTPAISGVFTSTNTGTSASTNNGTHTIHQVLNGSGAGDRVIWPRSFTSYTAVGFSGLSLSTGAQIRAVSYQFQMEALETGAGASDNINLAVQGEFYSTGGAFGQDVFSTAIGPLGSNTDPLSSVATTFFDYAGSYTRPITVADVNASQIRITNLTPGPVPELRAYSLSLYVDYNEAPSADPSIVGLTGGIISSTTPTINWTYTDPENDPQESARVTIYKSTDIGMSGPNTGSHPVLSIPISGSATTYKVTSGVLQNFTSYRAYVYVYDAGSNSRHNNIDLSSGAGGLNQGIDFQVQIDPYLAPAVTFSHSATPSSSFDPATGSFGNITVLSRQNLLPAREDASFINDSGVGSIGQWIAGDIFGAGITPVASSSGAYRDGHCMKVTATGTATYILSGFVAVTPGQLLTGSVKVRGASVVTKADVALRFIATASYGETPTLAACTIALDTSSGYYSTGTVSARVPYYANYVMFQIVIASTAGSTYSIDCAELHLGAYNILDDPSFESSGDVFWNNGVSAGTASSTIVSAASTDISTSSNPFSQYCTQLASTTLTDIADVETGSVTSVTGNKVLVSADARLLSGSGGVFLGFIDNQTGNYPQYTPIISNTWTRYSGVVDMTASTYPTRFFFAPEIYAPTYGLQTVQLDNIEVSKITGLRNGGFENGVSGNAIPTVTALAEVNSTPKTYTSVLSYNHDWQLGNNLTGSSTATYGSGGHSGSLYANLSTGSTAGSSDSSIEQWFSVGGYTSITADYWILYNCNLAEVELYFYDKNGILIYPEATPANGNPSYHLLQLVTGVFGVWAHFTPPSVAVPPQAVWGKIRFVVQYRVGSSATLFVDDVTITRTGTDAYVLPYQDGGWSGAGIFFGSIVALERAGVDGAFTKVRQPPNAEEYDVSIYRPSYSSTWNDYEWASQPNIGLPQTVYYRASSKLLLTSGETTAPPYSPATHATSTGSFEPNDWLLIDPLYPADNVALQVKKVTFITPETEAVYTPMGRTRKVIIADKVLGVTIQLDLQTVLNTQWVALMKQLEKQTTLALRSPDGQFFYVRSTRRQRTRTWTGTYVTSLTDYTVEFEEVDPVP